MKRLWISVVLLVALLGVCWAGNAAASSASATISRQINQIKSQVSQGNTYTALASSLELQEQWRAEHRRLCLFMSHDKLASVDELLSQIPALIDNEQIGLALSRCDQLNAQITQLEESEALLVENLF